MSAGTPSGLTPDSKTILRLHSPQWAGWKGRGRSPRASSVFVRSFVRSFVRLFVCLFVRLFVCLFLSFFLSLVHGLRKLWRHRLTKDRKMCGHLFLTFG